MKKVSILAITAAFLFVASTSFAVTAITTTSGWQNPTALKTGNVLYGKSADTGAKFVSLGRFSTNVEFQIAFDSTAYAIMTQHLKGSKAYATSFDATAIFTHDETPSTMDSTSLAKSDSTNFATWTSM